MPEYTDKFKWERSRAALSMLLGSTVYSIIENYGMEALDKIAQKWLENNKKAAPRLMEINGLTERTLESVAKIINFTDDVYGVDGEWVEMTPDRAVKIEKSCPLAKQFPREVCTKMFAASMTGIARGVTGDDRFVCKMPKCLAGKNPDDCCEIIIERE